MAPSPSQALEQRIQTICLMVLSAIALGAAMYWLRPVLIPLVLAGFISLGILSVIDYQVQRFSIRRGFAVANTLVMASLFFPLLGGLLSVATADLLENLPGYEAKIRELMVRLTEALPAEFAAAVPETAREQLSNVSVGAVSSVVMSTTNAILGTLSKYFLVVIFVLYLVLGSSTRPPTPGSTWSAITMRVQRYIVAKVAISAVTGVLVWAILALLGIDLALVFGMFAFLLNFIPSIGSIIATLLPLPVAVVSPNVSMTAGVLAIMLPGALQLTVGNLVEPRVMGESLDLHPVTVLVSLIFWGMLWGVIGMLLATPITAALKILFEKLEPTEPLARLMSGKL